MLNDERFKKENDLRIEIAELGIATKEEIDLVAMIISYSMTTLNSIIYARTGYHDLEQYKESEGVSWKKLML